LLLRGGVQGVEEGGVVLLVLRYQRGWSWFGRGGRWRGVGCSNFCGRVENDGGGGLWRRRKRGRVWSRWCCLKRGGSWPMDGGGGNVELRR
jgi:hypothetical protein